MFLREVRVSHSLGGGEAHDAVGVEVDRHGMEGRYYSIPAMDDRGGSRRCDYSSKMEKINFIRS